MENFRKRCSLKCATKAANKFCGFCEAFLERKLLI